MSRRPILLTGVPRGGTTLACSIVNQCANAVALVEPYDVAELSTTPARAIDQIEDWLAQSRQCLLSDKRAVSYAQDGALPDNPFGAARDDRGLRVPAVTREVLRVDKDLKPDFLLAVKHNAAFVALLPGLVERFEVWAVVRNPLAVLASWHSVDLPVRTGRVPAGERLEPGLATLLDASPEVLDRQLVVLDWFFERIRRFVSPQRIVSYESLVRSQGQALAEPLGLGLGSDLHLRARNANPLYPRREVPRWHEALLGAEGAYRHFYTPDELAAVAASLGPESP